MNYKEKKRSMFFGLPWTFTSYTITDEIITVDAGLLNKQENDCYMYKVIDVCWREFSDLALYTVLQEM